MLVPAATSIGIRCSSSQRMTPTCAMPRALPPPNATPTVGRVASRTMRGGRSASGAAARGVVTFWKGAAHPEHANTRSPVTSPSVHSRPAPGRLTCRIGTLPTSAISVETLSLGSPGDPRRVVTPRQSGRHLMVADDTPLRMRALGKNPAMSSLIVSLQRSLLSHCADDQVTVFGKLARPAVIVAVADRHPFRRIGN